MKLTSLLLLLLAAASGVCRAENPSTAPFLPRIKLTTTAAGIHHVSADTLAPPLGLTADLVRSRIAQGSFALLHRGEPVGWLPGTNGTELFFQAEPLHNNYTEQNVYWLVEGSNLPPLSMDGAAPTTPGAQSNGWFTATLAVEQDIYCRYELGTHPDSNYWFWVNLVGSHPLRGKFNSSFALDALGPTNQVVQLTVRVQGATTTNHVVALALNGVTNAAWTGAWSSIQPAEFTFAFPAALLHQGSNLLTFTAQGTVASQWWLDGWRLQYPRTYAATNGFLLCEANSNAVLTLEGFTSPAIRVFDVSQPLAPRQVTNLAVQPLAGKYSASFVSPAPDARYCAFQDGAALQVAAMEAVWPLALDSPTNRAACLILAPSSLLTAAQPLADYRNQQGLETRLVPLEAVYNEFNGGIREPEAIRTFLAFAWQHWLVKPAYALLIGNGTYDYRNLRGVGDNLLPPLMVPTLYGLAASDSDFGHVVSTPGPQIAVGRLPVVNAAQLGTLIAKIKAYEAAPPPSKRALLMADLPGTGGNFPADLSNVQATLSPSFETPMLLPGDTATMRSLLLSNLNAGADLFCYLGHGGADRLGNAGYLTTADVPGLTNAHRLPLVSAITCLSGFFAEPGYDCLAEALVLANQPGAIAVMSASGFSLNGEATELNLALMAALVSGAPGRLGDFVRQAMVEYEQELRFTPSAMYGILGDPALLFHAAPLPPPLPPFISGLRSAGDRHLLLSCAAQPGYAYTLLTSTNVALPISLWSVVSTGTVPFGPFVFDLSPTNSPRGFYRLNTRPQ